MSIDEMAAVSARRDTPAPADLPAEIATVLAALAECDGAHDAAQAEIAAAEQARRRLLLDSSPTGTAKLVQANEHLAGLRLQLERLGALEPQLVARLRQLERAEKEAAIARLVETYRAAIDAFGAAMRGALAARANLVRVRQIAVESGLERLLGQMDLPHEQFPLNAEALGQFIAGATSQLAHAAARPRPPELHTVRFLELHPPYRTNECAGFPASGAWALVDAGLAVFVDPKRRPPSPAVKEA